jgi:hypothetical protein
MIQARDTNGSAFDHTLFDASGNLGVVTVRRLASMSHSFRKGATGTSRFSLRHGGC